MSTDTQTGSRPLTPPRLLLGATLIVWGYLSDHMVLGWLAAVAVEGAHWIRRRWDVTDTDHVRVWHVCVMLCFCLGVIKALDGNLIALFRSFVKWGPMLMLPMILVQVYGRLDSVSGFSLSPVARHRREIDRKLGRPAPPDRRFHFGYVYFAVLLVSLGLYRQNPPVKTLLLYSVLLVWAFWPLLTAGRKRWQWGLAFVGVMVMGFHGQKGLRHLREYVENRAIEMLSHQQDISNSMWTRMGEVGQLKLSHKILWRVRPESGPVPNLLMERSFTRYLGGSWTDMQKKSRTLENITATGDANWEVHPRTPGKQDAIRIRGRIHKKLESIPMVNGVESIYNLPAKELYFQSSGTIRVRGKSQSVEYIPAWPKKPVAPSKPGRLDGFELYLDVPKESPDMKKIRQLVDEQGWRFPNPRIADPIRVKSVIAGIREYFARSGFRYTTYLEDVGGGGNDSLISEFLNRKAGHCEYYASATTLVLREAGIPARYCVGFSVQEYDEEKNEFALRGLHRHAWAQAWVDGKWTDVDTTPDNWLLEEQTPVSFWRQLANTLERWRIDFSIWRSDETRDDWWAFIPIGGAVVLLGVFLWRLLRGFRGVSMENEETGEAGTIPRPGRDSAWYAMAEKLAARTRERASFETGAEWTRWNARRMPEIADTLKETQRLHYRYRFDPRGIEFAEKERLDALCEELERKSEMLDSEADGRG